MKARPLKFIKETGFMECPAGEATHVQLSLPSPSKILTLPVILRGIRKDTGCWTWNGDTERPTLKPSVLVESGHLAKNFDSKNDSCWCKYYAEHKDETPVFHCFRCHSFINDGCIEFLSDSTQLAGQTLDLLDV